MVKTVIFDMDGVLVNSEPLHHEVSLVQFKDLNIEVTDDIFATFTGNSNKMIYQKLKDRFDLPYQIEDLILAKNNLFIEAFDKKEDLHLMPGVKDLIVDLHKKGMQVRTAENAEEAFRRLAEEKPDLILMDVVMPGQNGFQLTRAINRTPEYTDIPIFICTSKNLETDRVWGMRQGARDYVTKPVNGEELLSKIRALA